MSQLTVEVWHMGHNEVFHFEFLVTEKILA